MGTPDTSLAPEDAVEAIVFITRSRTRIRVLELASRERPTTRREFRARLDVARTTVQRNIDAHALGERRRRRRGDVRRRTDG